MTCFGWNSHLSVCVTVQPTALGCCLHQAAEGVGDIPVWARFSFCYGWYHASQKTFGYTVIHQLGREGMAEVLVPKKLSITKTHTFSLFPVSRLYLLFAGFMADSTTGGVVSSGPKHFTIDNHKICDRVVTSSNLLPQNNLSLEAWGSYSWQL